MADQTLGVAAQTSCEREELHADDRDRDRRLLRALRRARDQPGRGRDQADRGGDGARPEQRRERQAPGGRTSERERAQQRRLGTVVRERVGVLQASGRLDWIGIHEARVLASGPPSSSDPA